MMIFLSICISVFEENLPVIFFVESLCGLRIRVTLG